MSSKSEKLPAIQFYPGDWHKDPGIRALTLTERGFWFECLLLMHESERRGMLMLNGHPMPVESIAVSFGITEDLVNQILTKLVTIGVASVDPETGCHYSRRMVRDEKLRQVRKECGKLGGNPGLVNQNESKPEANGNQTPNQTATPSSSSSSSISDSDSLKSKRRASPASAPRKSSDLPILDKDAVVALLARKEAGEAITAEEHAALGFYALRLYSGRDYRKAPQILARCREGATADDISDVADYYAGLVEERPEFYRQYFDAATPFRSEKFDGLLVKAREWIREGRPFITPEGERKFREARKLSLGR